MDKEEIDEIVSRATELDELSEKAEKLSKKLESKVSKEIELKKEEAKVNQQKALEKQKEYFDNMKKSSSAFIQMLNKNGIGFNQKLADEIYKSRTEVVEEENGVKLNKIGAISRKDPEGFQNTMHLLSALGVFKTDKDGKISPDLSKLTKIGESKGAKKVITKVDEISKKFSQSKSTDDDFEDPLELLKETYG
jgi:predicted RNase H-like nuclease (RuvC/YqgF family)